MKEFDNFVEIYNILGYIANCVDIVCPIWLRKYISIDFYAMQPYNNKHERQWKVGDYCGSY